MQLLFTIKNLVALYCPSPFKFLDPPKDILLLFLLVIQSTLFATSKLSVLSNMDTENTYSEILDRFRDLQDTDIPKCWICVSVSLAVI